MIRRIIRIALALVLCLAFLFPPQPALACGLYFPVIIFVEGIDDTQGDKSSPTEQSLFGVEGPPIKRQVILPEGALQTLRKNEYVLSCLEKGHSPHEIPAEWFIASEIHLDGPREIDLIVMPRNGCLLGANVGPFWVFRKTGAGYSPVLEVSSLGLEVLGDKSNSFRDIRTSSATATTLTTVVFRFDGQGYKAREKKSRPIS